MQPPCNRRATAVQPPRNRHATATQPQVVKVELLGEGSASTQRVPPLWRALSRVFEDALKTQAQEQASVATAARESVARALACP